MITPRVDQENCFDGIRGHFRRRAKRVLWQSPTGSGKSYTAAYMLSKVSEAQKYGWFIVHRRELLRQTCKAFKELGLDVGIVAPGHPLEPQKLLQICAVNSLPKRMAKLPRPHLVIQDECHHLPCKSWSDAIAQIGDCYMVGLSATPCRMDGRGLAPYFDAIVHGLSVRELIDGGHLSPFRTFAPPTVDTSGLHVRHGDYIVAESEALMDTPTITGSAVGEYRRLCDGKRAIVFCCSIEHSKHVAEQFRNAGYAAYHIDGKTADSIRDMAIDDFERGKIQVLCNVDLCGEGLSINAIECVILLRPTQSLALYIQQVGRGLRTWAGKKELIILDHVGSTLKFGMIDEPREWTLTGDVEKRKKKAPPGIRVCPKCFAASPARAPACTNFPCDHVFEVKSREIAEKEGKLVELTPEQVEKKRARVEQGRSQTLEALMKIEQSKGYKPGWAKHVFEARQSKKLKVGT